MKKKTQITDWRDRLFLACVYTLLVVFSIIVIYPLIYVLSASFSNSKAVSSGEMWLLPVKPTLEAYKYVFNYTEIWTGYANTLFYTFAGTTLNLLATLPCAYALSRRDLRGRSIIMTLFLITMFFGGGMIPAYLNMKEFGLLNNRLGILIMGLVSTYNLIVARTFFSNSIPWELQEAAFIDGASDFRVYTTIMAPLSKPITVVLMLYYGVGRWNSYFNEMIYLRDRAKYPLQVFLKEILSKGEFAAEALKQGEGNLSAAEINAILNTVETANLLKYAVIVVSTVPMMILYPCVQKYFEKGTMIGSVKG